MHFSSNPVVADWALVKKGPGTAIFRICDAGIATILLMPFYVTGLHPRNKVRTLIPVVLANDNCTRREDPGKADNRRMMNWSPQFLRAVT